MARVDLPVEQGPFRDLKATTTTDRREVAWTWEKLMCPEEPAAKSLWKAEKTPTFMGKGVLKSRKEAEEY